MRAASRNNIAALFIVAVFFQCILALAISKNTSDNARVKAESTAIRLAIDTCRSTNPSRAYFQIRAKENPDQGGDTFLTSKPAFSERIFSILDCQASVMRGVPVLLSSKVEDDYLRIFRAQHIPITEGQRIVGVVSFKRYFSEARPSRGESVGETLPPAGPPTP